MLILSDNNFHFSTYKDTIFLFVNQFFMKKNFFYLFFAPRFASFSPIPQIFDLPCWVENRKSKF